jgi:Uma2 family endonuclease
MYLHHYSCLPLHETQASLFCPQFLSFFIKNGFTQLRIAINNQLTDRDCEVYASDMRVKVNPTGLYTYPDVVIVCGEPQFEDNEIDTLLNPTVIVEVLSKTTEGDDRGEKFEHYRSIESLSEVVLIAQNKRHVEYYRRQEGGQWVLTENNSLQDRIKLTSINCELALSDIYKKVRID